MKNLIFSFIVHFVCRADLIKEFVIFKSVAYESFTHATDLNIL